MGRRHGRGDRHADPADADLPGAAGALHAGVRAVGREVAASCAGAAAVITAVFIVAQIVVYVVWPPPATAAEHLALVRDRPLLGLLSLDLLYVVDNALLVPILLALYVELRRFDESVMALGATLGLVSVASLVASNPAANMHYLAGRFATAASEAERAALLAAGEAMLALNVGMAYHVSLILGSVALVAISVVMLRSGSFNRSTAWLGILANVLAFGLYLPVVGLYVLLFSTVLLLAWYVLIAVGFLSMGRPTLSRRAAGRGS